MRKAVLIIFGGRSSEHEVSVRSARAIADHLDPTKFKSQFLGISLDGSWNYGENINDLVDEHGRVINSADQLVLPIKAESSQELRLLTESGETLSISFDIIFPVLHGPNGEDGSLQGMLELLNIPFVGAGILGSALAMDKAVQKKLCELHQLPQPKHLSFTRWQWSNQSAQLLDQLSALKAPYFIKPANLGSSVGINRAETLTEVSQAIEEALQFDHKIIIEEGVTEMKEVEVSVLGNEQPQASVPGELVPHTAFYDYETKYVTDDISTAIPADLPPAITQQIQAIAIQAYRVLDCRGMARVDFFYQPATQQIFLNEVNTIPGFTSISMYPKLWAASGLSFTDLVTQLIELGQSSWQEDQLLKFNYQS